MENKAGNTKFKLSKTIKSGNTISLHSGDFSISWGLDGANTAASQIVDNQKDTNSESHNDQFLKLKKLHNEILYKDALPGIDVQYLISSNTAKENIILKTKDTQKQFTETYQIGDLTAKQVDDKTIELFEKSDAGQEKPVYTISAPLMSDAKGIIIDAVEISILQQNAGVLKIALHTDETWLNAPERAYPATIDPEVEIPGVTNYGIHDTFVANGPGFINSNNDTMGTMYIGNETAKYKTCWILVKFDLPQLNKGDMIVGAQLNLSQLSAGMDPSTATMQINAYEMKSSWDASTATWNNTSSAVDSATKGNILDYVMASQATAGSWNSWDVTKAVKNWYNGATNYGFVLKAQDEAAVARNIYFTSNYPNGENSYPYMMISFVNNAGLEDYWSYHSQSAGRAGTGAVNDYTGNLVFSTPIMNTTGERVPLDFSITYNNYRYGTHFEDQLKGDIFGWGWQSNLSERVDSVKEDSGTNAQEKEKFKMLAARGYKFIYLDEDGTEHYFKADGSKIIDEDGLGLEMTSGGAESEYFTMLYADGSKKTFTAAGYLYRIYDNEGNYLTLSYYGSYLSKVTDGAGRETTIDRSGTGAVTKITGPDNKETKFYYTGGNLTSITYPDNKTIQYSYDASNQLQRVTNVDGTYIQYAYYDGTTPMVKNRVKETAEYSAAGAIGNKVTFTYNTDNTTTFTYYKVVQTYAPQQETFTFDRVGRTTSVLNMDGSAATYSYTAAGTKKASANKITSQTATSAPVSNLLLDHNAERNKGTWTGSNWSSPGGTFSVDSSQYYLGSRSLKIEQKGQTNPARSGAVQKLTTLSPGTTYTFSGYVKTDGVTGGMGANLYVACFKDSTSLETFNGDAIVGTNDWQRTSLTFTVPAGANRVELYGGLSYANGTAWFDCLQLETGSISNIYNLLENGEFRYSQNYIPTNWDTTNFTSGDGMSSGDVRIVGNATLDKELYQEVVINRPAKEIAFVASGKSTGKSVPINSGRRYEINVKLFYTDGGTPDEIAVPFNPDTTGTQYTSGPIASSKDKTISKLTYSVKYNKNANDATFKHLQLNMDETGTTFEYNESTGKMTSSRQNAISSKTYTYTDAKELKSAAADFGSEKLNKDYSYTYSSGNAHRLQAARSNKTGVGMDYGYDSYGNITSTKMGTVENGAVNTNQPYLQSTQSYSTNGNYLISSTDQRGKVTSYDVSSDTGLINSVTDPRGNQTSYTYNTQNNLLEEVRAQGSAGLITNSYRYDTADRLNKITHNGFDYTLTRDGYGNTTIINVGSRNLITNYFNSGNGNLNYSQYGNGFKLGYGYDSYDRVNKIYKNDNLAYEYVYDARGNLAKIVDKTSGSNEVTAFSYDIGDRLIKKYNNDTSFIQYSYDNMDRSTDTLYEFAGQKKSSAARYDVDDQKEETHLPSGGKITYQYDSLNREQITDVNPVSGREPTLRTQRSFINLGNNKTTTLLDTYTNYGHNTFPVPLYLRR
jgi:Rhs family protein